MKRIHLILSLLLLCILAACSSENIKTSVDEASQTALKDVSYLGATIHINLTCKQAWTARCVASWCTIAPADGEGNATITVTISPNNTITSRTALINISSDKEIIALNVVQQGVNEKDLESLHYKLPVVFHVLYKTKTDETQYLKESRIQEVLRKVNEMYRGGKQSADFNLEFELVTTDDKGNRLETPGVDYIKWEDSYPIDFEYFMSNNGGKYKKYLWDPNRVINIMMYNFKAEEDSDKTVLGISHLPFSYSKGHRLEGLQTVSIMPLSLDNLSYTHCISINSIFINAESTANTYSPVDIVVTIAHELGHHLGLFHVFSEAEDEGCTDTDYCQDTESYNRDEYISYMDYAYEYDQTHHTRKYYTFENLIKRKTCEGDEFISYNVMDYSIGWCNRFSDDQKKRIRHVLMYSPLRPGPKAEATSREATPTGIIDLPIVTME